MGADGVVVVQHVVRARHPDAGRGVPADGGAGRRAARQRRRVPRPAQARHRQDVQPRQALRQVEDRRLEQGENQPKVNLKYTSVGLIA